jgi:DNA-binding transcriptional LysR family regulator
MAATQARRRRPSATRVPAVEEQRWLGIQGRHLSTLVTVAREGTFAGAARRLGYTQSTISHQVATLERLVGERLLERGPGTGTVEPTPAGALLLEHAEAIMARLGAARADLSAVREADWAPLRVGLFPGIGTSILPPLVAAFRRDWPEARLELVESDTARRTPELVAGGELDLAFTVGASRGDALEGMDLVEDRFVLLAPPASARERLRTSRWTLVAPTPCSAQERTEEALLRHGFRPREVVRVEDAATIAALVASGASLGLVPALGLTRGDAVVVLLDGIGAPRCVRLVWHRERTLHAAGRRFAELARLAASALAAPRPAEAHPPSRLSLLAAELFDVA